MASFLKNCMFQNTAHSLVSGGLRVQYMSEWSSFLNVLESLTNKMTVVLAFAEEVYNKYPTLEVDYQKVLEFYQFLLNVSEDNVIRCIGVWTLSLLQLSFLSGPCFTIFSTNNNLCCSRL